jgi:hypothetical protein
MTPDDNDDAPAGGPPAAASAFRANAVERAIVGFHQDDAGDWVAELACGHNQHVRHNPPWTNRPWVLTERSRHSKLGAILNCRKCDQGARRDWVAAS